MKAKALPLLAVYAFTAFVAVGCNSMVAGSANPEQAAINNSTEESLNEAAAVVAENGEMAVAAPDFSLQGSDGNTHTLASLTKDGTTVVLYFIKSSCPINADALPFVNQIGNGYLTAKKVKFVGIIDEDKAGFDRWNKKWGAKYLVLFNKNKSTIQAYGAQRSPWFNVVSPTKSVTKVDQGYSSNQLDSLNKMMANTAGTKAVALKLSGAPSSLTYG
ncbi:redoxin domain-containing protein [Kamptonema cortianum]|nr:redoxin domain-containing protein [Geitlerinema splendidum]MDK3155880.1 redoxin domain-containing protein [Kamptonema cortianum]